MQIVNLEEITVKIKRGEGGCAISSMMIYGLLRTCFAPVKCIVENYAYSGSFLILQGAAKRVMRKGARLKFHWATAQFDDDAQRDIIEVGELFVYLTQLNERLYDVIQGRSGLPRKLVCELYKEGAIISAPRALKLSLADKIE